MTANEGLCDIHYLAKATRDNGPVNLVLARQCLTAIRAIPLDRFLFQELPRYGPGLGALAEQDYEDVSTYARHALDQT